MEYNKTIWNTGDIIEDYSLNNLEDGTEANAQTIEEINTYLKSLESSSQVQDAYLAYEIDRVERKIDAVDQRADDMDDDASDIRAEIADCVTVIDRLRNQVADAFTYGDELDRLIAEHDARIDMKADANEVAGLHVQVDKQQTQIDSLSGGSSDLADTVAEHEAAIEDLESQLSERVSDIAVAGLYVAHDALSDKVDGIDERTAELEETIKQKAAAIDVADHAVLIDGLSDAEASHYNELIESIDRIDTQKAERNELAGIYNEADQIRYDIKELEKVVDMKADANSLAGLSSQLDITNEDIDDRLDFKADANALFGAVAILENGQVDLDIDIQTKASKNDVLGLAAEVDRIDLIQSSQAGTIALMQSKDADLTSGIATKVNKPTTTGTVGQVLSLGENDSTLWVDPINPSDEQIGDAVASWLDDHPEATTTVADGSITLDKLSQEVQDAIEDAASAEGSQILGDAIALKLYAIEKDDTDIRQHIDFYNENKQKLMTYANYFDGNGIGFLFYTDPHSLSDHLNMQYEDALIHLKMIRRVYENTPAKYVLLGGDWIDGDHPFKEAKLLIGKLPNLIRTEIGERCYMTAGNHDFNTETNVADTVTDGRFTHQSLARIWFDSDVCYYVIHTYNVDCYVFDSGPWTTTGYYNMEEYDHVQSVWFADKLMQNTTPHLYGLVHNIMDNETDGWLDRQVVGLANAFNNRTSYTIESGESYNFSNAVGTFHFIITGHQHTDKYHVRNNIPLIYTTCSRNQFALDCCYADFDNGVMHCVRIGVGESRDLNIIPTIT